tara:strand:- start:661 stop:1317 length:657 start_codon:yes stop_codon:yes gene_type:complete
MIDQDIIQRFKVAGIFLLQIYKVTTGTLTSIFIPQDCGNNVCSIKDNYENSDNYHKMILYWNFLSMLSFFIYYIVELKREEWAIKYLDIDHDKPDNSLKNIIIKEPILDKQMDKLNRYYYVSFKFNCMIYFMNILMTVKLIKNKYYNISTISCFFSFTLLIVNKLYNSYIVVNESIKNDKMMSAYMSEFVSFNVLDSDYIEKKNKVQHLESIIPSNKP